VIRHDRHVADGVNDAGDLVGLLSNLSPLIAPSCLLMATSGAHSMVDRNSGSIAGDQS
jgi:hypothetical protein